MNIEVDVWGSGVSLFNMCTGKYPFEGDNVYRLYEAIGRGHFEMPTDLEPALADLLAGLLRIDPVHRLALHQVTTPISFITRFGRFNCNS